MTDKKLVFGIAIAAVMIILTSSMFLIEFSNPKKNTELKLNNDYPIDPILTDMTISITNGKILSIESSKELPGIIINIDTNEKGRLIIEDPIGNLKKVLPDKPIKQYTVIIDGEEVKIDTVNYNIVAVTFNENAKRIEIVALAIL